jgi:hypothetical protein
MSSVPRLVSSRLANIHGIQMSTYNHLRLTVRTYYTFSVFIPIISTNSTLLFHVHKREKLLTPPQEHQNGHF